MCDNEADTPFCSPQSGTQVRTGETVEIIWNPLFFAAEPPDEIFIQADFPLTDNGIPETAGFTSTPLDPNAGSLSWAILGSYLPPSSNTTTALLSIAAPLPKTSTNGTFIRIGDGTIRFPGPQVHILRGDSTIDTITTTLAPEINPTSTPSSNLPQEQQPQEQQPNPTPASSSPSSTPTTTNMTTTATKILAITLPTTLLILTALALASYILLKRHRPTLLSQILRCLLPCRWGGRRERGYGERQSRAQRVRLRGREVEIKVVRTGLGEMKVAPGAGAAWAVGVGEMERGVGGRGGGGGSERGRREVPWWGGFCY